MQDNINQKDINQRDTYGKKHGLWVDYYLNDKLWYYRRYVHGYRHGIQFLWYNNGQLCNQETLDMNKRIGYYVEYNFSGSIYKKRFYAN
jgi:antitoxin component YwqK of YwqJK toxin-antitoxin module